MTNREYLSHMLAGLASPEMIETLAVCSGQSHKACLNLEEEADGRACDLALYNGIPMILARGATNITEGGYSISYNAEALRLFYKALASRLGMPDRLDGAGRVRFRSF